MHRATQTHAQTFSNCSATAPQLYFWCLTHRLAAEGLPTALRTIVGRIYTNPDLVQWQRLEGSKHCVRSPDGPQQIRKSIVIGGVIPKKQVRGTFINIMFPGDRGAGAPREVPGRFREAARHPREVQQGTFIKILSPGGSGGGSPPRDVGKLPGGC